jgi:hypothetical protein
MSTRISSIGWYENDIEAGPQKAVTNLGATVLAVGARNKGFPGFYMLQKFVWCNWASGCCVSLQKVIYFLPNYLSKFSTSWPFLVGNVLQRKILLLRLIIAILYPSHISLFCSTAADKGVKNEKYSACQR